MTPNRPQQHLAGWRSRAWSLVLFVALLRGLLPHAALAGLLDDGSPQLAWCAPGKTAPGATDARTAHLQCICAPSGEATISPAWISVLALPSASPDRGTVLPAPVPLAHALTLRARGPPRRLG
ncbi:MAG: hypothetical protein Q8Q73_05465 [Stagnimonas sp.]|nr:hypothetical protein [Stagnimonas sp.]